MKYSIVSYDPVVLKTLTMNLYFSKRMITSSTVCSYTTVGPIISVILYITDSQYIAINHNVLRRVVRERLSPIVSGA